MKVSPDLEDRLAARQRPEGLNVMHQDWHKLLFLHWEMRVEDIRHLIPEKLAIDTLEGKTWLTITPLTITNVRPPYLPALPYLSWLWELNVRTYVHLDGVPGVWFFSLDASRLIPVAGARALYRLPYVSATIDFEHEGRECDYRLKRDAHPGEFHAAWTINNELPKAEPGSLEYFLVERYTLYAESAGKLFRARIHHEPWPLQRVELHEWNTDIFAANNLATPAGEPMLHGGGPVHVAVWPLEPA